MTCPHCNNTDPDCPACHEQAEPTRLPGDPLEEEIDRLMSENPET